MCNMKVGSEEDRRTRSKVNMNITRKARRKVRMKTGQQGGGRAGR